jgi:hypothetical protein
MDISIYNGSSDAALLFSSVKEWRRSSIVGYLPKLASMLSVIRDMEFLSKEYMNYITEISSYVKVSLKPELQFIAELSPAENFSVTSYSVPKYLYAVSFINPSKMTVSVNKLTVPSIPDDVESVLINLIDVRPNRIASKISAIFETMKDSPPEDLELDSDAFVIDFPLYLNPYRRVEVNVVNVKNKIVERYQERAKASQSSEENSSRAWKSIVIFLIIMLVVVAIAGVVSGLVVAVSKYGNHFEERHITNVYPTKLGSEKNNSTEYV